MRRAAHALWLYGLTVLAVLVLLPALLMPRPVLHAGIVTWSRLQMWGARVIGGVRVELRGLERLPAGPVLVAGKHQSFIDIVSPFLYLGDPAFVLKKELVALPLFGWHCRKAGMIPVDREAHARALRDLVAQSKDRLAAGCQIVIFPEGTRKAVGEAPDYKPGVAALYRELGLPCVPVATNAGQFFTGPGLIRGPGHVVYEILEPIPAGLKRGEFMRQLQERVEAASSQLLQSS